jgi:hypothetical protein
LGIITLSAPDSKFELFQTPTDITLKPLDEGESELLVGFFGQKSGADTTFEIPQFLNVNFGQTLPILVSIERD